jgi:hypothetical protein
MTEALKQPNILGPNDPITLKNVQVSCQICFR